VIPAGGSLERADNSGFGTGNPAVTLALVAAATDGQGLWFIGGAVGARMLFLAGTGNVAYQFTDSIGFRNFTATDTRKIHRILFNRAALANISDGACRQDALDLSLGTSVPSVPNMTDSSTVLYGANTAIACDIEWNVNLPGVSATDAAKVEQWMRAAHETPF
jgi:hypothetical protein